MAREIKKAVAYLRTSSAANVGQDKDSDKRQLAAIHAYAKANGFEVVDTYYDAAVSGADPVTERRGFMEMLGRVTTNGAKTILVESPDRFARDLMVQLAGYAMLKGQGIALIPTTAPDFFMEDTPTAVLIRQVLGAIAEFDKASTVAKLAAARKRKREANPNGKCEGRKSLAETRPEVVAMARALRDTPKSGPKRKGRANQKATAMSLRAIAAELAAKGYLNEKGATFNPKSVAAMLA